MASTSGFNPSALLTAEPTGLRLPTLALVPAGTPPRVGLLLSALAHAALICAVLTWLPRTLALRPAVATPPRIDIAHERDTQMLIFSALPLDETIASDDSRPSHSEHPKRDFAGPTEIISLLPDATNNVQTIRQPEPVAPTKLTNPVFAQTAVRLPAKAVPVPSAAQLEEARPKPRELPPVPVSEHEVESPALLAGAQQSMAVAAESPSKITATAPETNPPAAVVVINAVSVPAEPMPVIPAGELAGHFVVAPSEEQPSQNAKTALSSSSLTTDPGAATKSALSHDTAIATLQERPTGIAIVGGVPAGSGRSAAAAPGPRNSYGLTIISAGTSGGASRDLGVFSRSDRVYTVGIPMTDAGGGPDWSMEYALVNAEAAGDGLLTPPVALKKVRARAANTAPPADAGPVFVTGVIGDKGKVESLRAIRPWELRAQAAVEALERWEFLPARLNGMPVVTRVLIGVAVVPAEEVGIQD